MRAVPAPIFLIRGAHFAGAFMVGRGIIGNNRWFWKKPNFQLTIDADHSWDIQGQALGRLRPQFKEHTPNV
jgi:hypothetical protein